MDSRRASLDESVRSGGNCAKLSPRSRDGDDLGHLPPSGISKQVDDKSHLVCGGEGPSKKLLGMTSLHDLLKAQTLNLHLVFPFQTRSKGKTAA